MKIATEKAKAGDLRLKQKDTQDALAKINRHKLRYGRDTIFVSLTTSSALHCGITW